MRIVYAGTPDVSASVFVNLLEILQKDGKHQIVGVLTNPPSTQGRHKELVQTPVAQAAEKAGFLHENTTENLILTPQKLDGAVRETISSLKPDLLVCFAYGKIFGPKFMALFPNGGINFHPSLLPLYRGCAPVPTAILNCEQKTGVTVQRLAQEMDSGDILGQKEIVLTGTENSESLLEYAASLAPSMLYSVVNDLQAGTLNPIPQDGNKATFCTMLKKEDGLVDWTKTAKEIEAKIRAFYPWPGAYTMVNGVQLRLHRSCLFTCTNESEYINNEAGTVLGFDSNKGILIKTGDGIVAVSNLQWQSKKAMNFKDFLNGSRGFIGTKFDIIQ